MRRFHARPLASALAAAGALALLAGCETAGDDLAYVDRPVEELYNAAVDAALAGDFRAAAPMFDEVERQHPYSVWATRAQLMAAHALYQDNKYDEAVAALDRFIELNPGHPDVDYAYYLKGLSFYERIVDVGRDQKLTREALDAFDETVRRFPDGKYARDARLKIDLARNHLAGKELAIGRFYLRRGKYLAAIERFRVVIREYDTTDQAPEALHRLTEAYLALGLTDEAMKTAAVLGHNYPGSPWYRDTYALVTTSRPTEGAVEDKGWFGLGFRLF